ncbi:hypothetical protein DV738_g185, partial [Chaetothyriales sp. CBS 135597]
MAASVPAGLKTADISRFAVRAGQLEKAKPIAAYWCNYWIVNQILSKGLHNTDEECLSYTSALMDRLEKFKEENADEPAVSDDVAGKAYMEQFGLETFARADNAVRANKASRQTADTFQAAATFLDLLAIWGNIEPEITTKIKYAKFHAVRIAKAIRAGEDPNLSNPAAPARAAVAAADEEGPSAAVDGLSDKEDITKPRQRQPSVVEVTDDSDERQRALAQTSTLDQSLHPSRDVSAPPVSEQERQTQQRQASVTEVADEADQLSAHLAQQSSLDQSLHPSRAPSLPRAAPGAPDVSAAATGTAGDAAFYNNALPQASTQDTAPPVVVVDEDAMARAQKHARWAISALNFEDVPTAIRELRAALTDLGG